MSKLVGIPNVGAVLEKNLLAVGIETPEQLQESDAREVFLRIRTQTDQGACLHMLYGIQGAISGIPYKFLSQETKDQLKAFYRDIAG